MPVQIPNHSHCVMCSRAVPFADKTCSPECANKWDDVQRRRKRNIYFLYAMMALAIGMLMLTYIAPGLFG